MKPTPPVRPFTVAYLRCLSFFGPSSLVFHTLAGVFRGLKDTRTLFLGSALAALTNVGLDVLFVFGMHTILNRSDHIFLTGLSASPASLWVSWPTCLCAPASILVRSMLSAASVVNPLHWLSTGHFQSLLMLRVIVFQNPVCFQCPDYALHLLTISVFLMACQRSLV